MTRALRPVLALAALLGALVFAATGQAQTSCSSALLQDWRDGGINGTYPVACYRTDLRIYSSAESDIKRALLARSQATLAAPAKAQKPTPAAGGGDHGVSPFLVLAIAGAILALTGSGFALVR